MNKTTKTRINSIVSMIAASIVALGCAAGASTAFADEISLTSTKIVSYSDLNLDSPAGASAFYHRLRAAAHDVCSSYDSRSVKINGLYQQCFDSAVANSVSKVNKATVTALHEQSMGRVS